MERLLSVTSPATALVQPNLPDFDWDRVRRLDGVAAVGTFRLADVSLEGRPGAFVGYPPTSRDYMTTIEHPTVVSGRLAVAVDEAVAPTTFLRDNHLRRGDVVVARIGDIRQPLRIVGVVRTPILVEFSELTPSKAFAERYRDAFAAQDRAPVNAIVRLAGGEAALPAFRAAFANLTGRDDIEIVNLLVTAGRHARAAEFEATVLLAFALAAALAAAVLIAQATVRFTAVGAADLERLRTLGMTPRQATLAAAGGPALAAVTGTLAGIAVAVAVSGLFPIGAAADIEPFPGIRADLPVLAVVGAAVVALTVSVAVFALFSMLAERADRPARRSVAAVVAYWLGLPVPIIVGVRMALEPGRGRTAIPVRPALVGAIVGVLGIVGALTFRAGAVEAIANPARFGQTFQFYGFTGANGTDSVPAGPVLQKLARDRDVVAVNDARIGVAAVSGTSVTLYSHETVGSRPLPVVVQAGRMPLAADEIALAPTSARDAHATIGATVTVSAGSTAPLKVTGIAYVPEGPHNRYAEGAWVTGQGYRTLFPDGVPLGVAAGRTLWRVVADQAPLFYAPPLALTALILVVPGAILTGVLLAALPARKARRLHIGSALRAE
ncbi:hypothetical protein J5X84_02890 [Streptosporangiaceae bacterium NEAU-GS5]|nr:hypothetical protein [Streptosporangiaceae bacterium NEAU-GS5]